MSQANGSNPPFAAPVELARLSGVHAARLTTLLAPTGPESIEMARRLRERLGLTISGLACLLGVWPGSVDSWLKGREQPNGCAKRLLWLLERHASGKPPASAVEWMLWNRDPAEPEVSEALSNVMAYRQKRMRMHPYWKQVQEPRLRAKASQGDLFEGWEAHSCQPPVAASSAS